METNKLPGNETPLRHDTVLQAINTGRTVVLVRLVTRFGTMDDIKFVVPSRSSVLAMPHEFMLLGVVVK